MPNYDYQCTSCGEITEIFHKITEDPEIKCPSCSSPMKRKISGGAGLMFKGSGYYVTDYKTAGGSSSNESSPAAESPSTTATPQAASAPAAEKKA